MPARIGSFLLLMLCTACTRPAQDSSSSPSPERKEVILLTTTSLQDSGLGEVLLPAFKKQTGYEVKMIVAGSGDILKQGSRGEGDVLLTHSPAAEKEWMKQGYGDSRRLVMYNDFIVLGPPSDPAQIKGLSAAEGFKKIAEKQAGFVSRGDQSGTHVRELAVWKKAATEPKGQSWYRETGQGQGLTMDVASQQQAYALTDRGTFLVHQKRLALVILIENDPALRNIYHVMTVDAKRFSRVNSSGAKAFADFLVSSDGQKLIEHFGKEKYGRSLFTPAADKKEEDLLPR